ncbi:MAG: DNA gyrase inhibitor YacG [Halobacteria archaeon]|nr:DNA gyrase inhibitor YacG [Halobacteria archaeon]
MTKIVKCPTCGKDVKWDIASKWRPFCSERCRLIDLGEWANESHRIQGDETLPQELIDQDKDNHH